MSKFKLNNYHIFAIVLVFVASISRLFPFIPNFQPIMGIALFAGAIFSNNKKFAFLIPISAMLLSDVLLSLFSERLFGYYIGFHDTMFFVYLAFALIIMLGMKTNENSISSILLNSVAGAIIFFIVTNLAVWMFGIGINNLPYEKSLNGLIACFAAALPFFKNTLISSVFFSSALFGAYYLGERYLVKSVNYNTK